MKQFRWVFIFKDAKGEKVASGWNDASEFGTEHMSSLINYFDKVCESWYIEYRG